MASGWFRLGGGSESRIETDARQARKSALLGVATLAACFCLISFLATRHNAEPDRTVCSGRLQRPESGPDSFILAGTAGVLLENDAPSSQCDNSDIADRFPAVLPVDGQPDQPSAAAADLLSGDFTNLGPEALAELKEQFMRQQFGVVRRAGKWIPTVNGGTNLVYITTGSLPPGKIGEEYEVRFEAVSGFPPYRWRIIAGELPETFEFDPVQGRLHGVSAQPCQAAFLLEVTDVRGERDMAGYYLVVQPDVELEIATETLASASPGQNYFFQVQARGGVPPYTWSAQADLARIGTLTMDPMSGVLSGQIAQAAPDADIPILVHLRDSQLTVTRELTLRIRTVLSILTPARLAFRAREPVDFSFQAAGGVEPYIWGFGGQSPAGLAFDATGRCSGMPLDAGLYRISLQVQDSEGRSAAADCDVEVLPALVVLSDFQALLTRNSVGLRWRLPSEEGQFGVKIVRQSDTTAHDTEGGIVVYRGAGTWCLDSDVGAGTYRYTAWLENSGAIVTSSSPRSVRVVLPPSIDPFADEVVEKQLLHPNAFRSSELPGIVLGAPKGRGIQWGSADVVSLGAATDDDNGASAPYGGAITLAFLDNEVWNGPGPDFTVFENVFYVCNADGIPDPETRFMEPAIVSVSQDGKVWRQFPVDFSPRYDPETGKLNLRHPYCYNSGFAGVNPVMSNGLEPDPTDPAVSGGDSYDLDTLGLDWIRYVRIQSTGNRWLADKDGDLIHHNEESSAATRSFEKSGFDLDAVTAIWMTRVSAEEQ